MKSRALINLIAISLNLVVGLVLIVVFHFISSFIFEHTMGYYFQFNPVVLQDTILIIALIWFLGVNAYYRWADIPLTSKTLARYNVLMLGGAVFMAIVDILVFFIDYYFLRGVLLRSISILLNPGEASEEEVIEEISTEEIDIENPYEGFSFGALFILLLLTAIYIFILGYLSKIIGGEKAFGGKIFE